MLFRSTKFHNSKQPAKKIEKIVDDTIMTKKTVSVNVGLNNVHEIMDEIRLDH